jgi:hypothetical protein
VKPLADLLWTLVRWTLPLTAAALVVTAALGTNRMGEEVRRRVEARLQAEFPALEVRVRAANLVEGEGIVVRGIEVADPAGVAEASRRLLSIEEAHLACGTALTALAAGDVRITAVRLHRPTLHVVRGADGGWSIAALVGGRSGGVAVPVTIDDATLVIDDAASRQRLTVRHLGVEVAPTLTEAGPRVGFSGGASGDPFDRAAFDGELLPADGSFRLAGSLHGVDLEPQVQEIVAAAGVGGWPTGLRGRVDLVWQASGRLDRLAEAAFSVTGRLRSGRFEHAALPFAVSDLSATFQADRAGATCQDLEGHAGPTLVRGSGRLLGWSPQADFDLLLETERLHVGRHWEGLLPEPLAAQWSKLLPAGEIDVRARVQRRAGVVDPDVAVRCRNVSITHYRFPYRLDHTVGTVTFRERTLGLHLTGQAGGHPVHVGGTVDTSVPGGAGVIEVHGDGMRIDDALLAALPPRSADIVRRLRASGSFDFRFRHERGPGLPDRHFNTLDLRITQGSMSYTGFPYPLSGVTGLLRMEGNRWTIRELVGTNDTGVVRCSGGLEPVGRDDGELTLQLTGQNVVLEPELRDALPPGMQRIWEDVDPRGTAEFTAVVRHRVKTHRTTVELEATPEGESVSIEPAWFPYRLERLQGRLVWRDGQLLFERIRGIHQRTVVATEGRCRFTAEGGWHVAFGRLAADRFRVDHDLLQALPAGLRDALAAVELSGLLSLEGTLDIYSTAAPANAAAGGAAPATPAASGVAVAWNMHLDMAQAALDVGVPLEHVHGGIHLRGQSDGTNWRADGQVALDSAIARGVQLTHLRGPIALDAGGVRFGGPAVGADAGGGQRLSARVTGGTLLVDGSMAAGSGGRFTLSAGLHDADLARLTSEATGVAHRYRGRVQAGLELTGSRAGTHSLAGRGQVRLRDADLYELPVIVALLKMLRVKAPDRNAFTDSVVDFRIEGPHAYLDTIELSGDAISLVGTGAVDFDGGLDLTFRSIVGDAKTQLPVMKRVLGGASGQFMLIHVDGTLAEPLPSAEAFPTLAAALQRLQTRQPGGPRTALRP